jgi:hypothetical protein
MNEWIIVRIFAENFFSQMLYSNHAIYHLLNTILMQLIVNLWIISVIFRLFANNKNIYFYQWR